jgi:hypothetical protein
MKKTSRVGNGLRALAIGVLGLAWMGAAPTPARADACFGGGHPNEPPDAGEKKDSGSGDGSMLGLLRSSGARRKAGTGLVLIAGLGGAWLGTRRKGIGGAGGGHGDDQQPPLT